MDGFIAIGFAILGMILLTAALTFPPPRIARDPVGPMGLPLGLALIFIVGGGLQAYRSLWLDRELGPIVPPDGPEDEPGHPVSARRGLGFAAGGLAYVLLLIPLGYLVATPLFIALGLWAMDYRSRRGIVVIAVSFTVIAFVVFSTVLHVPVPTGILSDLLVALKLIPPIR
jgi:hypothetical protein